MLLNYNKPVLVSSTLGNYNANLAVDESIKTYWSAATATRASGYKTDLGALSTVNAIQINYADQDCRLSRQTNRYLPPVCFVCVRDGKKMDHPLGQKPEQDGCPHDYTELEHPVRTRFIKMENRHMSSGKFAISGLRVFGNGRGTKPDTVKDFIVLRTEKDKRSAWIKWRPMDNAYGYNLYFGTAPDKLYSSIMVYDANDICSSSWTVRKPITLRSRRSTRTASLRNQP